LLRDLRATAAVLSIARALRGEIEALQHELATLRQKGRRVDPRTIGEVETGIARLKAVLREAVEC
jgi:ribosomal protein L29